MDETHRKLLLQIARCAIEARLAGRAYSVPPETRVPIGEYGGVFVSLHNGHRLRGCVGRLDAEGLALPELVRSMAVSVLQDPRFSAYPVTLAEMAEILIELSVLSPMKRSSDPLLELEPGVHGVYIRRDLQAGCFLPQVAPQMHWDSEQLLSRCCSDKAGLAPDAWRDPSTEVFLFTADVFSEPPR